MVQKAPGLPGALQSGQWQKHKLCLFSNGLYMLGGEMDLRSFRLDTFQLRRLRLRRKVMRRQLITMNRKTRGKKWLPCIIAMVFQYKGKQENLVNDRRTVWCNSLIIAPITRSVILIFHLPFQFLHITLFRQKSKCLFDVWTGPVRLWIACSRCRVTRSIVENFRLHWLCELGQSHWVRYKPTPSFVP